MAFAGIFTLRNLEMVKNKSKLEWTRGTLSSTEMWWWWWWWCFFLEFSMVKKSSGDKHKFRKPCTLWKPKSLKTGFRKPTEIIQWYDLQMLSELVFQEAQSELPNAVLFLNLFDTTLEGFMEKHLKFSIWIGLMEPLFVWMGGGLWGG